MGDGNLRLEASANFGRLEQAMDRQARKTATLEDRIARMGDASRKAGGKSSRAMQMMVRNAQQVIATYAGIHSAIALANAAVQEEIMLREKAGRSNQQFQERSLELQFQTLRFTDEETRQFKDRAMAAGRRASLTDEESLRVSQSALSATDDPIVQDRIDKSISMFTTLADMLGPVIRDAPGIVGMALDLKRSLGEGATDEEVAKFSANALSISRISKIEDLPNLVRTIAAATAILPGVKDEERMGIAEETLALFAAFQANTSEEIGATTSTAIANFINALRQRTGRNDLSPIELLQFIDPDDPEFKKLTKGKSFSKPVQQSIPDKMSRIRRDTESNLIGIRDETEGELQRLKERQLGVRDPGLRAFRSERETDAFFDRLNREERAIGASAVSQMRKALPFIDPGLGSFLRRAATKGALNVATPDELKGSISVTKQALREAVTGENLPGFIRGLPPLRTQRLIASNLITSEEEILRRARLSEDERTKSTLFLLERLQSILAAQVEQQKQIAEKESKSRTEDNAKLTDTVGRTINSSAQDRRVSSEQEN